MPLYPFACASNLLNLLVSEEQMMVDLIREEKSSQVFDDDDDDLGNCTALSDKSEKAEYSVVISRKRKRNKEFECYDFSVVSDYCPTAIFEYLNAPKGSGVKINCEELRNNARKHLSATGWKFWSKIKNGNDEWRYESPTTKKTYYSLMTACKAIAKGDEKNTSDSFGSKLMEVVPCNGKHDTLLVDQQKFLKNCRVLRKREDVGIKKEKEKKNGYPSSLSSQFGHEKIVQKQCSERLMSKKRKVLGKLKSCPVGHDSTRVLRSSKRVRQIETPSVSKIPKTVLSWLIENNAVVPRSKVYYCKNFFTDPMAKGIILRGGIRCGCCQKLFSLSGFQAHAAGNNILRPAENMFLEDGKSLVSCQVELMRNKMANFSRDPVERDTGTRSEICSDYICSICHYGGELMLCDRCPSSFHPKCLNLQDVPEGDWFCPSCCCGVCGSSQFDDDLLRCQQCERQYHARCKTDRRVASSEENWFCCKTCEMMQWGLQQLLGKPILVGHDNLTWTLVKPMQYQAEDHEDCDIVTKAENFSKLSVALEVMHECFEPVKDPQTRRDLVEDVLFCRRSELNRLNFKGFYTVLLERNDELIAVAILRIYGDKVAEIPLIGTGFHHRRLGMCRVLMNEIEKNLLNLGVQKLVLPAAPSVLDTWTTSFGFSPVTESDRSGFLGYTFLDFQDTIMCQKLLRKLPSSRTHLWRDVSGVHHKSRRYIEGSSNVLDHEGKSSMSEDFQEDQHQGSDTFDQGAKVNGDHNSPDAPSPLSTLEFMDHKKFERDKSCQNLKFYKRKKAAELRPPVPQARYSVSCR